MGIDLTISADGHWTAVETNKDVYDLDILQERVDGFIEVVGNGEIDLVLDEEGLLKQKPLNYLASALARAFGILPNATFVGDVVVCTAEDGEIKPLSKEQCAVIQERLEDWQPLVQAWMKLKADS